MIVGIRMIQVRPVGDRRGKDSWSWRNIDWSRMMGWGPQDPSRGVRFRVPVKISVPGRWNVGSTLVVAASTGVPEEELTRIGSEIGVEGEVEVAAEADAVACSLGSGKAIVASG